MLKQFTKKNVATEKNKGAVADNDSLPNIYREEYFDKLEKPKSAYGLLAVVCLLAVVAGLAATFTYDGFFREQVTTDKTGQKIVVDKQENITVTSEERLKDMAESAGASVAIFYPKATGAGNIFFESAEALGTGIVLTSDGWLVTTKGLINKIGESKYIILANKKAYEAQTTIKDPASNLVFIKLEARDLPVAKLGDADLLVSGQTVYGFIGNYPSAKLASLHVAEVGLKPGTSIVESTEKMSASLLCREGYDASLVGAPIINLAGEVVALINDSNEAVLINYLKPVLDGLLKRSKIERTLLGVNYIDLAAHPQIKAKDGELEMKGAIISGDKNIAAVAKNSPGDKAGLKTGDIIVAIEDETLGAGQSLGEIIQSYSE